MLGSFVIGIFAASTTIGLANEKSLAVLPKDHPWQSNFALQIGIRTGYCGSLTTFSAWIKEVMTRAIEFNAWMNAIIGILVGLYAAIFSYQIGIHAALYIDRWLIYDAEDVLEERAEYDRMQLDDIRRVSPGISSTLPSQRSSLTHRSTSRTHRRMTAQQDALDQTQYDLPRIKLEEPENIVVTPGEESGYAELAEEEEEAKRKEAEEMVAGMPVHKTDVIAGIGLILLTAWCIVGTVIETEHTWLRQAWVSLFFAPFGCFVRWQLSRLNYKIKGKLAWTPAGTYAANMIGTAISAATATISLRCDLSYWGSIVNEGVSVGFCGAMSTVSTLVTEIVKFAAVFPENAHAYTYTLVTILSGVVLVFAIFGWAVWAY